MSRLFADALASSPFPQPKTWLGIYKPPPELNNVKMAVALDMVCHHTGNHRVVDFNTCKNGLMASVDRYI